MPQDTCWLTRQHRDASAADAVGAASTSQRSSSSSFLLEEDTFCDAVGLDDSGGGGLQGMQRRLTAHDVIARLHRPHLPRHETGTTTLPPLPIDREVVSCSDPRRSSVHSTCTTDGRSGPRNERQLARRTAVARPAACFIVEYTESDARMCLSLLETETRRALFRTFRALGDLQRTRDATCRLYSQSLTSSPRVVRPPSRGLVDATRFADRVLAQADARRDSRTPPARPLSLLEYNSDVAASVECNVPRSVTHAPTSTPPAVLLTHTLATSKPRTSPPRADFDVTSSQVRGSNRAAVTEERRLAHKQYDRFFRAFYDGAADDEREGRYGERHVSTSDVLRVTHEGLMYDRLVPAQQGLVRHRGPTDPHHTHQRRLRQPRATGDDEEDDITSVMDGCTERRGRQSGPKGDPKWRHRATVVHDLSHAHEVTSDVDTPTVTPQQELDAAEAQVSISL